MPETVGSSAGLLGRGLRLLAIFVVGIALFVASLTAVFAIPQSRILVNLRASLPVLRSEGLYPRLVMGGSNNVYRLDNLDDAHWLDIAIVTQPGGPLINAMGMYRGLVHGKDTIALLAHDLAGPREAPGGYSYYWHGYQLLLRPALLLFSYGEIRYLNIILMGVLAAVVAVVAARKTDGLAAGAFVFALLFTGFWAIPLTINLSSDAYLMLIGSLVVLLWADKPSFRTWAIEAFFVLGMLTAFFDNATNPIITVGVPLAFALISLAQNDPLGSEWRHVGFAAKTAAAWLVGFVGSWVSKWLIGSLVLGTNVFQAGVSQFMFRVGTTGTRPQQIDAIIWNVHNLFPLIRPHRLAAGLALPVVAVLVFGVLFIWFRRPAAQIRRVLPVLVVAPLPFAYYALASNLTLIHNWLSYHTLVVAVFPIVYVALAAIDFEAVGRKFTRRGAPGSADTAVLEGGQPSV